MHDPIIEGVYKVTSDTIVILITVEQEEYKIQWACDTSISIDAVEPETLKESMSIPYVHLCKMSAIYEVNGFMSINSWIPIKRSKVNAKGRDPLPLKRVFKSN